MSINTAFSVARQAGPATLNKTCSHGAIFAISFLKNGCAESFRLEPLFRSAAFRKKSSRDSRER
eukprot:2329836-Prymnesium_polylepis.1